MSIDFYIMADIHLITRYISHTHNTIIKKKKITI